MVSKYAGLKGKVPTQPTERSEALKAALAERRNREIGQLTLEYNKLTGSIAELASQTAALKIEQDACEILILEHLDSLNADGISGLNDFTWSEGCEPYPVCEDPAAIVQYFQDHGMSDQLELSKSELAARLKKLVKEEADNNELIIETREIVDETTGETRTVNDVRSNVPGVKVFLKHSLSRRKSAKPRS